MSTKKPDAATNAPKPEERDGLDLDAEMVADLEPGANTSAAVRGGASRPTGKVGDVEIIGALWGCK